MACCCDATGGTYPIFVTLGDRAEFRSLFIAIGLRAEDLISVIPLGDRHARINLGSPILVDDWRCHQIPSHNRERGGVAWFHFVSLRRVSSVAMHWVSANFIPISTRKGPLGFCTLRMQSITEPPWAMYLARIVSHCNCEETLWHLVH
jgi:hypothetical protein